MQLRTWNLMLALITMIQMSFLYGNDPYADGSCFEVGADFLYWKPCFDEAEYAGIGSETITGNPLITSQRFYKTDVKSFSPNWQPGFRVFVEKKNLFCNIDFYASYDNIHFCDKRTHCIRNSESCFIVSPLLDPLAFSNTGTGNSIFGVFKQAEAKYNGKYQYWDAQFGLPCNLCCGFFKPYFGAAGIVFDQSTKGRFTDQCNIIQGDRAAVKWNSNSWGAGVKLGGEFKYPIWSILNFFVQAEGSLLAGQFSTNFAQFTRNGVNASTTNICLKKCSNQETHFIPGYNFSIGLDSNFCFCSLNVNAHIGYEMLAWNNLPSHRIFSNGGLIGAQINSALTSKRTLGFHGLFTGASIGF